MNRFYFNILLLASLTCSSFVLHAQIGGRGVYDFLDASGSSRIAALGGTLVPIDDHDLQLTAFNPALINPEMHNKLSLSYVDFFSDINFGSVQYSRSYDKLGSFAAGIQYNHYGSFYYTDETGQVSGEFNVSDYAFSLGWGRQLDSNFSIGSNLKFVGSQYESYHGFGIAVDVAGNYLTKSGWMLSLTARNIGTELVSMLPEENNMMPFSMQFGVSKRLDHVPLRFMFVYDQIQKWDLSYTEDNNVNGNVDPITGLPNEKNGFEAFGDNLMRHLVIGSELYIGKNLVLRGSYNYRRRQELQIPDRVGMVGFAWGLGIRISKFQINYSRSTYHVVGSPNYLTLNINLDQFKK
ncbi:MAG: type IX secretion system protein PorQ [Bacteroidales bacterium]